VVRTRVILPRGPAPGTGAEPNIGPKGLAHVLKRQERRRPSFSRFWLSDFVPRSSQPVADYSIGDAKVRVVHDDREMRTYYILTPWEHILGPDLGELVSSVIDVVSSRPLGTLDVSQEELREAVAEIALAEADRLAKERRLALPLSVDGHARAIEQVAQRYYAADQQVGRPAKFEVQAGGEIENVNSICPVESVGGTVVRPSEVAHAIPDGRHGFRGYAGAGPLGLLIHVVVVTQNEIAVVQSARVMEFKKAGYAFDQRWARIPIQPVPAANVQVQERLVTDVARDVRALIEY